MYVVTENFSRWGQSGGSKSVEKLYRELENNETSLELWHRKNGVPLVVLFRPDGGASRRGFHPDATRRHTAVVSFFYPLLERDNVHMVIDCNAIG